MCSYHSLSAQSYGSKAYEGEDVFLENIYSPKFCNFFVLINHISLRVVNKVNQVVFPKSILSSFECAEKYTH